MASARWAFTMLLTVASGARGQQINIPYYRGVHQISTTMCNSFAIHHILSISRAWITRYRQVPCSNRNKLSKGVDHGNDRLAEVAVLRAGGAPARQAPAMFQQMGQVRER